VVIGTTRRIDRTGQQQWVRAEHYLAEQCQSTTWRDCNGIRNPPHSFVVNAVRYRRPLSEMSAAASASQLSHQKTAATVDYIGCNTVIVLCASEITMHFN